MRECGEFFFADELSHAPGGRDIAGCQRGETCRVKISGLPLSSDFLTVLIHQEHNLGSRIHSESCQDSFDLMVLLLSEQKRRVCHWYGFLWLRGARTAGGADSKTFGLFLVKPLIGKRFQANLVLFTTRA